MMSLKRFSVALAGAAILIGVASGQVPQSALSDSEAGTAPPTPVQATQPPPSEEVRTLRSDLDRLFGEQSARATYAVLVVSLDRGDTLFSHNPDLPVAPASNMKLYSTAAALYYLGPSFRYSTFALADGEIQNGALLGDLVLYGTGDPAISSRMLRGALSPLRALADSLRAHGITEIRGDVVGDGSYFDDTWVAEGWREQYRLASYSAPVGALSLAENIVSVRVMPGGTGEPAQIRTTPATDGLLVQNMVRTAPSGRSSVRFSYHPEGLVLEGQIARGHPGVARTVTVVDPANFAASAFRTVLEEAGIRVHGDVRTIRTADASPIGRASRARPSDGEGGSAPRVVGTHLSPTLAEVTSVANHVSQNLFAEAMFKTVGRVALGDGSFAGGARAVQYFLECERPVDFTGVRILDGSGLSPLNRVTARTTIHLLDLMTRTDVWDTFYLSLPEAASPNGGQHSLRNRMGGTAAARNLRAKTGTISNVSSLSGYVHAANGELLAFSIIGNDLSSTWLGKRTEDAVGSRLARFTRQEQSAPIGPAIPDDPAVTESTGSVDRPQEQPPTESDSLESEPEAAPETAAPEPRVHRVVSGDNLEGIARRYGTTVSEIERLNPGIQPRRLQLGQSVRIPG
ncbi:MAG: D-alanyl-D-alanine carboxypeptidase/D-alanyl-D-alanine-endopeptidase [Gemmatimonadota bacterium]